MTLRDVMNGLMYARGESCLQASLNPFVKRAMQENFKTVDPEDPYNKERARQGQAADERAKRAMALQGRLHLITGFTWPRLASGPTWDFTNGDAVLTGYLGLSQVCPLPNPVSRFHFESTFVCR